MEQTGFIITVDDVYYCKLYKGRTGGFCHCKKTEDRQHPIQGLGSQTVSSGPEDTATTQGQIWYADKDKQWLQMQGTEQSRLWCAYILASERGSCRHQQWDTRKPKDI